MNLLLPDSQTAKPVKMDIVSSSVRRGCNLYHDDTVILLKVELSEYFGLSTADLEPEFAEMFAQRFLEFSSLIPDFGRDNMFAARLKSSEGVPLAEVLLEAIISVEHCIASTMRRLDVVEYAEIIEEVSSKVVTLIWATRRPGFSRSAAHIALSGLKELLAAGKEIRDGSHEFGFSEAFRNLQEAAVRRRLPSSSCVIIEAAKRRNIPYFYAGNSTVWLGQGKHQSQFRASMTGKTSFNSATLASNKRFTIRRLAQLRLPVPHQVRVSNSDDVIQEAQRMGFPVVVKPTRGSRGRGITTGIKSQEEVLTAFQLARKFSDDVILERWISGEDFRLLVVGGKFKACLHRLPPTITGTGLHTIRFLIDQINKDPHRDGLRMSKVEFDEELNTQLLKLGYSLDSILEQNKTIPLRSVANVSKGGIPVDVTDEVHPDNIRVAERAANGIGLDVAGIDFITEDIKRSHKEVGGAIIEVNARPGLCIHTWPRHGQPRNVGGALLGLVYPNGRSGRVQVATILGEARTAVVARDLEEFLRLSGQHVGLIIRSNTFIKGKRVKFANKNRTADLMLRDPEVESLVCTASPKKCLRRGLRFDHTDTAAIMDHVEDGDIDEYRKSIEILLKSKPKNIIIGEDNKLALDILSHLSKRVIILISTRGITPTVRTHLESGGMAVTVDWIERKRHFVIHNDIRNRIAISNNTFRSIVGGEMPGSESYVSNTGHRSRSMKIRMFSIALAHSLGLSPRQIEFAVSNSQQVLK